MHRVIPLPPEDFSQSPGCRLLLRERNDSIPTAPLPSWSGTGEIRVKGCAPADSFLIEVEGADIGCGGVVFRGDLVLDCNNQRKTSGLAVEAPAGLALRRSLLGRFHRRPGRHQINVPRACYLVAQPNYAAWLIGEVPRLRHYQQFLADGFPLVVHGDVRPHHLQALELCGVDREHLLLVPPEADIAVGTLIYSSPTYCDHIPSPLGVRYLQSLVGAPAGDRAARRHYLGRMNCPQRRILNEEAVQQSLARLGFEARAPESLPVAEQVALFASAEMIVTPFGATLANLAFSSPSVRVCVIRTKFTNEFARIAHLTSVRLSVFDQLKRSKRGFCFSAAKKELHQVFTVDVAALTSFVRRQLEGA